jgi:succinoglycan biosynthesis protein ExoO
MSFVKDVVVTVVTPTYNAASFLAAAVASVQAQTMPAWELIIVDDGSTDDTVERAEALAAADARIRLIRMPTNGGPSVARNAGFAAASGKWIAVLDADDVYLPERLSTMIQFGEEHGLDVIVDNLWLRDPSNGLIVRSAMPQRSGERPLDLCTFYLKSLSASGFDYGTLKPIFRAEFLRKHRVAYRPQFRFGEDFVFFAELLARGAKAAILPNPMYVYTLTLSEINGQQSAQSRTKVDLGEVLAGNNFILGECGENLSGRERRAISCRARNIERYDRAVKFKDDYRRRDFKAMLSGVRQNPFICILIYRAIVWRLRARFSDMRPPSQ